MVARFTIDRLDANYAVCLDDRTLDPRMLLRAELPREAQTGDTLFFEDNRWQIDREETAARAVRIQEMFDKLKNRE